MQRKVSKHHKLKDRLQFCGVGAFFIFIFDPALERMREKIYADGKNVVLSKFDFARADLAEKSARLNAP